MPTLANLAPLPMWFLFVGPNNENQIFSLRILDTKADH